MDNQDESMSYKDQMEEIDQALECVSEDSIGYYALMQAKQELQQLIDNESLEVSSLPRTFFNLQSFQDAIVEVKPNKDGFLTCPYCGTRFDSGTMHVCWVNRK